MHCTKQDAVLHQVLSSETSAEKGYPFPSHPRNPFYEGRKKSTL